LGIEHIGVVASREIAKKFWSRFLNAKRDELLDLDGFGEKLADSFLEFIRVMRIYSKTIKYSRISNRDSKKGE